MHQHHERRQVDSIGHGRRLRLIFHPHDDHARDLVRCSQEAILVRAIALPRPMHQSFGSICIEFASGPVQLVRPAAAR